MKSIEKQLKELENFPTDKELNPEFNKKYGECLHYVGKSFIREGISYKNWREYSRRLRGIYMKRRNLVK